MVFQRSPRGSTLLLISAVLIALGFIGVAGSQSAFLYAGIGIFLFYYVSKLFLAVKVKALDRLEISRSYSRRMDEGKTLDVGLTFLNRTFVRLNTEFLDNYPSFFRLRSGSNVGITNVPGKGYSEVHYEIAPTSIGAHLFGPIQLLTRDMAGLFFYERTVAPLDTVSVTPHQKEVARGTLAATASVYAGSLTTNRKGEGMEFADVREYEPGDPFKRIEWLSTARTGRPMVRELHAETQLNVMVLLDSTETMAYGEAGQTKLDYSARSIASLLGYLSKRGDFIGLTVMRGSGPEVEVVPLARGQLQVTRMMQALGRLSPRREGARSLGDAVRRALALGRIKGRTLFFVISDLDTESDLNALKQLLEMKHEVVVVSPFTPLFEAHGLKGLDRMIYAINTSHQWRTRDKLVREAARLGIPMLDVGPRDLFAKLVLQVEELRRKGGS